MCPNTEKCPIYNCLKLEITKNMYRRQYCEIGGGGCKRKELRDAGKPVPPELLPDGKTMTVWHLKTSR